jgi:hypothetical protein
MIMMAPARRPQTPSVTTEVPNNGRTTHTRARHNNSTTPPRHPARREHTYAQHSTQTARRTEQDHTQHTTDQDNTTDNDKQHHHHHHRHVTTYDIIFPHHPPFPTHPATTHNIYIYIYITRLTAGNTPHYTYPHAHTRSHTRAYTNTHTHTHTHPKTEERQDSSQQLATDGVKDAWNPQLQCHDAELASSTSA